MPLAKSLGAVALLLTTTTPPHGEPAQPNPAAALCAQNGATVTIETAANGAQHGICVFPNGSRIDEWAYFRNKHRLR